uniref:Uncharacterized protein n=1 Tax=Zea mays TaxID=4577 RepID=C0P2L5_MAIZE|nr:unknown [Zea mays]
MSSGDSTVFSPQSIFSFFNLPQAARNAISNPSMETHERCTILMSWRHRRELSRWHRPSPVTWQYDIVSCLRFKA